ncbi:MAG: radical SAM family heme chaperone HemW [Solirubrobacterales bacterium]
MDRALYIHVPFCKSKCLYCDFCSYSGSENLMMDYSISLAEEIKSIGDCRIKTIFIGGGTPTYLPLECLKVIDKSIKKLNKDKDIEFTIEGNPGTFSFEKLEFLRAMGANRLSIGLQASQNHILKTLGRIHSFEEFLEGFKMARKAGFQNINVDLMFGIPGQTMSQWKETLRLVVELEPEHISAYSLIIEEGTVFFKEYNEGNLLIPEENLERDMYNYAKNYLKEKGYIHYEISNFSKPGKECRHNLVYWDLEEYFGCGVGAHSYINSERVSNESSIEGYINGNIHKETHINNLKDDMEEFMFMGLRKTDGISIDKFNKRFKIDINEVYGKVIDKYMKMGLLIKEYGNIRLSDKGIEVSNSVMCEFIF